MNLRPGPPQHRAGYSPCAAHPGGEGGEQNWQPQPWQGSPGPRARSGSAEGPREESGQIKEALNSNSASAGWEINSAREPGTGQPSTPAPNPKPQSRLPAPGWGPRNSVLQTHQISQAVCACVCHTCTHTCSDERGGAEGMPRSSGPIPSLPHPTSPGDTSRCFS